MPGKKALTKKILFLLAVCLGAVALWALHSRPGAGEGPALAPHRALYDLRLVSAAQGAGITGLKGTMYYTQGDACDAWTSEQRFTMVYDYPARPPAYNTNSYTSWEAKDGARLEFTSESRENGRLSEDFRGTVTQGEGGALSARYTRPEGLSYEMPGGALLPTAHTQEIIRRARAGEKMFGAVVFDGTDSEGPVYVTAVIGKRAAAKEAGFPLLSPEAWNIRLAAFPLKDQDAMLPSYEMDLVLHANGIVSHALVDYRTFRVEQSLKTVEALPAQRCP